MKKIILLTMVVMALFVNCTGLSKKTDEKKVSAVALSPNLKGGIYLTGFYTGMVYDDLIVKDKDGKVIFEDDFSKVKPDWQGEAEWETVNGQLQMLDTMTFASKYAINNNIWEPATIIVKGKKVEGDEGICLGFGSKDDSTWYQFNVGGWNNTKTALQFSGSKNVGAIEAEAKNPKFNTIAMNTVVELKVVLNGKNIKCYMDNQLVIDYTEK